jgi:hypothetical protein
LLSLSFLPSIIIKIDLYIVLLISLYHFFSHDHHYHRFVSRCTKKNLISTIG